MTYTYNCNSPIGRIYIAESDGAITYLKFGRPPHDSREERETPLLLRAVEQLDEYFAGRRREFDLPLNPAGTEFQKKAWNALLTIPYGETRSYKEQADIVGNIKACRAVGAANGKNPISIFIPCHRVIGTNGTLTGYGGGIDIKKALLQLERDADKIAIL